MNILFITLDQFRGDCLSAVGHPIVRTPHLDRLAREGVLFRKHYSQAAPCGPGRACLYTGTYQMNNRVVANGTPLDRRFDNIALAARRAGYVPALFGYTDQGIDPRSADGPEDPRLSAYEEILPGFDAVLDLRGESQTPWIEWLRAKGYDAPDAETALRSEGERAEELSLSTFLTDGLIGWIEKQREPWFAHASYLRPHPPYRAAGSFAKLYRPEDMRAPIAPADDRHPLHEALMNTRGSAAPKDGAHMARRRAQYFGMISEVDHQLGRLWQALERLGAWRDTVIVVTADHGEQLGDHGLIQKSGFFEQSYHILSICRDPRHASAHGSAIDRFTENVDLFPTICDAMDVEVPAQCDGHSLTPFLRGQEPASWRDAAHWEFDWRSTFISRAPEAAADRALEQNHLAVLRTNDAAYVQLGDGSYLCFDLARDPTWRTQTREPSKVLSLAQQMLVWRGSHADRTMTGMLLEKGGIGRWPPMPAGWGNKNVVIPGERTK